MLAHIIEDVTLVKSSKNTCTTIHVRFTGGKTETLTAQKPKAFSEQVKTPPETVALIDDLLDDHIYTEIADRLNQRGIRPGSSARPGFENQRFCVKRVAHIVHSYGLRSRYDRLRARDMLTRQEMAARLGVHETTVVRWATHGIVHRHAYNGNAYLYEDPGPNPPVKQPSRWNRLVDRAGVTQKKAEKIQTPIPELNEV